MLILGSKSQRRYDILSYFSIPFEVIGSSFDERSVPFDGLAHDYVQTIAVQKGTAIAQEYPEELILTADTTVYFDKKVLNKPQSYDEAFEMLSSMNGKKHEVVTGLCVRRGDQVYTGAESTYVEFNRLSEAQIRSYIKHVDVLDKAGSYAIQGVGSLLVKEIKGCFYNVMGLPLNLTAQLLKKMDVDLWRYIVSSYSQA